MSNQKFTRSRIWEILRSRVALESIQARILTTQIIEVMTGSAKR